MQKITVKQYCKIAGISAEAVSYRMKKNIKLPGVTSYYKGKDGKSYVIVYDGTKIKDLFRTRKKIY